MDIIELRLKLRFGLQQIVGGPLEAGTICPDIPAMKRRTLLGTLGLGGLAAAGGVAASGALRSGNRYYQGPQSDHFDGEIFFNPGGEPPGGFRDLIRWQFGGGRSEWPKTWPTPFEPPVPAQRVSADLMRVTMVGHATVLLQVAGLNILTDPVWSDRCSPVPFVGPLRVNPPGIRFDDLPRIDLVLLSHNHYDHMDAPTLRLLRQKHDPLVLTPLGNGRIMTSAVPGLRVAEHDWGDMVEFGPARIHFEPVHHWSARGVGDRRMALWAGFVVETPAGKVYHVGDTGFHDGINYRDAAARHGAFRLAILPIGAYEPRWFMKAQHQNPEEAVAGMQLAGAAYAVGHHWGTFQLTNEPIEEPRMLLEAALERAGIAGTRFRPMLAGETWNIPPA